MALLSNCRLYYNINWQYRAYIICSLKASPINKSVLVYYRCITGYSGLIWIDSLSTKWLISYIWQLINMKYMEHIHMHYKCTYKGHGTPQICINHQTDISILRALLCCLTMNLHTDKDISTNISASSWWCLEWWYVLKHSSCSKLITIVH